MMVVLSLSLSLFILIMHYQLHNYTAATKNLGLSEIGESKS